MIACDHAGLKGHYKAEDDPELLTSLALYLLSPRIRGTGHHTQLIQYRSQTKGLEHANTTNWAISSAHSHY